MRIFVYEHLTGGGSAGGSVDASLAREGLAMLRAIAADIAVLRGVTVTATLDERVEEAGLPESVEALEVSTPAEALARFDALAHEADGVLLIAPELDGALARLARRVLEVGGRLLGPALEAIEAASDKLLLPRRLAGLGIPCVPSVLREPAGAPPFPFPVVTKPRFGAGSTDALLARSAAELPQASRESVITPFTPGLPASVLAIAGPRGILPLRAGEQLLSADGRFRYLGGRIPLPPRLEARAQRLAVRAVNALPGLLGFAGVDLLLDAAEDAAPRDAVVEVNPRLTTSYVGLRALAASNIAEHWLRAIHGEVPAAPLWRPGSVRFRPDGAVEREEAGA